MMKISTKTGDDGKSSLFNGKRLKKSEPVFEVLGGMDELNAFLGWVKVGLEEEDVEILERVQDDLFKMMGAVGNCGENPDGGCGIGDKDVGFLEKNIERLEGEIGELKGFSKPGENERSSRFHVARTVCRRLERGVVRHSDGLKIEGTVLKYLNRLSDLLFLMGKK